MNMSIYFSITRLRVWLGVALAFAAALGACGGGVETGGTGATGVYVQGPVTGFGSIIVAGIRFDESNARIEDADGSTRSRDELRLGMVVEVESGALASDGSGGRVGTATRVRLGAQLLGPVTHIDLTEARISVLGQTVRLTLATVLDGVVGGAASLRLGDILEVHGFFDVDAATANYAATRVERRSVMPPAFRVRGIAREIDSVAKTLRIGSQVFDLSASGLPAGLADGSFVRLTVQTAQGNARWPVITAAVESRRLEDRSEAEVEGLITSFNSNTSFAVNGVTVDAGAAVVSPSNAVLARGVRVKVEGRASGGVLIAARVELRSDDDTYIEGVDLRDVIANLDRAGKTFTLRGVTVSYGTQTQYDAPASEAGLANGVCARARAVLDPTRTRLLATRITFVDDCAR